MQNNVIAKPVFGHAPNHSDNSIRGAFPYVGCHIGMQSCKSEMCHSLFLNPSALNRQVPGNPDKQPEVKLPCSCGDGVLIKQQQ